MTTNYSIIKRGHKNITQLWLITPYGEVFIHKFNIYKKKLNIDELTIVTKDLSKCLEFAKCNWEINQKNTNLEEVYRFESHQNIIVTGYVLLENKDITGLLNQGKFISYHSLDNLFKRFELDVDFKEAYYSLLSFLDNRFGTKVPKIW